MRTSKQGVVGGSRFRLERVDDPISFDAPIFMCIYMLLGVQSATHHSVPASCSIAVTSEKVG